MTNFITFMWAINIPVWLAVAMYELIQGDGRWPRSLTLAVFSVIILCYRLEVLEYEDGTDDGEGGALCVDECIDILKATEAGPCGKEQMDLRDVVTKRLIALAGHKNEANSS